MAATTTSALSCSTNVFPVASSTTHSSYQSLRVTLGRFGPASSQQKNKKQQLFAQLGLLQLKSSRGEQWQERSRRKIRSNRRRLVLLSERIPWDSSSMRAMTEESAAEGGGGGGGGSAAAAAAAAVATTTSDKLSAEEEEEDQAHVSEIFRVLDLLKKKRDMSFAEVKLTIMIEDPREVQRRKELDIEDGRGCSREDLANALVEINEGRMPADRLVLRELAKEMTAWPNLEDELQELNPAASPYAKVTPTGVDPKLAAQRARIDWDAAAEIQPGAEQKELTDMVPPAVGFSLLYVVSFIPIIIGVTVVLILFFNSLQ
ncbi:hypothetical protein BDL97_01G013200 [Sphagnum fallax]|nr:hypothetical protein BDL97_01G013200 [Sphagnum fallax]